MNEIKEEKNNSSEIIDIYSEKLSEYSQKALIDRKILAKILKSNFLINSYSGVNVPALEKIKFYLNKHHMFYGINLKEKVPEYSLTTNKIIIPLISKKDIYNKLEKILEKNKRICRMNSYRFYPNDY